MKKIDETINKSKIIFLYHFIFMFSVNRVIATDFTEDSHGFMSFNDTIIEIISPQILLVVGMLIFFVFIAGTIIYLFYKKSKNKRKIVKAKRIISLSLRSLILIFALYSFIVIFGDSLINILDRIN